MSAKFAGDDCAKVKDFVSNGGVLIRFAGERMTGGTDDLVPVKLRVGGRYLGSAMAWAAAAASGALRAQSPFNGLEVPPEVTVTRQVLAEPSVELQNTQLGAADRRHAAGHRRAPLGQGWIVLFHITASPGWSSLPLSGLYVDMLKRLLGAVGRHAGARAGGPHQPAAGLAAGRFRPSGSAGGRCRPDCRRANSPRPASRRAIRRAFMARMKWKAR